MGVRMWVSVEDELPELLKKVLFHWFFQNGTRNISMGYRCEEGWDIYLPYHSFKMHPERLKVTHWRDLIEFPDYSIKWTEKFWRENATLLKRLANR